MVNLTKTSVRFRVNVLLRLIEACTSAEEERKTLYMDEIEALLFDGNSENYISNLPITKDEEVVYEFVQDCNDDGFEIEHKPTADVYRHYCEYCLANGYQAVSNIVFSKHINKLLNFKTKTANVNGKSTRIFVSAEG